MYKIALVNPGKVDGKYITREDKHVSSKKFPMLPYTVSNLLGLIEKKIKDVDIQYFDGVIDNLDNEDLYKKIEKFNPNIVICLMSWISIPQDKFLAETKYDTIGIIFQQFIPTYEAAKKYKINCKYILKNEIEGPLLDGIRELIDINKIINTKGFLIKKDIDNGEIDYIDTGIAELYDAESTWTFPNFEKAKMSKYVKLLNSMPGSDMQFILQTSKGCAFKCAFCGQANSGKKLRAQPVDLVIKQIQFLYDNYGITKFTFIDNIFSGFRNRAKDICRELIKSGLNKKIRYDIQDRVRYYDDELAKLLVESGCEWVKVGVETSDPITQKYIDKSTDYYKEIEKMKLIKKYGLKLGFYMISGIPGETTKTHWLNAKFYVDSGADGYSIGPLFIMPGSPLYYRLKIKNLIIDEDWTVYRNKEKLSYINSSYKTIEEIYRKQKFMSYFVIIYRFFRYFQIRVGEFGKISPIFVHNIYGFFKKFFAKKLNA